MKHEELKARAEKVEDTKVWEKGGKCRIYVEGRNGQQTGYITANAEDVRGRNADEYKGLSFSATRPGNVNILMATIDELLAVEMETPEAEKEEEAVVEEKKASLSEKETQAAFEAGGVERLARKIFETFDPKGRTEAQAAVDRVSTRCLPVGGDGDLWLVLIKIVKAEYYADRPRGDWYRS